MSELSCTIIPQTVSPEEIGHIHERHGIHLADERGRTAQERLVAALAIGQYEASSISPKRMTSDIANCLQDAETYTQKTADMDSEPEARIIRAAARLLIQSVVTVAKVEQAAGRNNLRRKTLKSFRHNANDRLIDARRAINDSLTLFASPDDRDKAYAKRILGHERAGLNRLQADLVETERGVAKRIKKPKKK